MTGKPIDEAVRLLREYREAPKFSNDHDAIKRTVALEDEIDAFLAALTAAQQQGQGGGEDSGEVNMDVTVRDGTWVGTYAEWRRRKQGREVIQRHAVTKYRDGSVHVAKVTAPPSAPVGVGMERFREPVVLWGKAYEYDRHGREAVVERRKPIVDDLLAIIDAAIDQQPAATAAKDAEIEALRAEVERLTFEMERLQQQYDERTACMIVHRGSALACSDSVRAAYSDEHERAERLAEALREIANQGPHYGPDGTYKTWRHWAEIARAALEQEKGRG